VADIVRPAGVRLARRVADLASAIGACLVAILYGAAYGCIGFYIGLGIYASGADEVWAVVWLLAWVAVGSVALTVWTLKWTGIGASWFKQDNSRTDPTPAERSHRKERLHGHGPTSSSSPHRVRPSA